MERNVGCNLSPFVLVFAIFMTLKLCNVIKWSWLWVTAPLWIGGGIALLWVIIITILVLINR